MKRNFRAIIIALLLLASPFAAMLAQSDSNRERQAVAFGGRFEPTGYLYLVQIGGCTYVVAAKLSSDSSPHVIHHAACQNLAHKTP